MRLLTGPKLVLGFHPDQATDAVVDLALALRVPFAVVPCCTFPSEFPRRRVHGNLVRSYDDHVEFLRQKHPAVRVTNLDFGGQRRPSDPILATKSSTRARVPPRSKVLYMLPEDFAD